jgi:hypothetical protein
MSAQIKREGKVKPVTHADGSLHNFMLKVAGRSFSCDCGCNVFTKPDDADLNKFKCNSCGVIYESN